MCKQVAIFTTNEPQKKAKAIVRGALAIHHTSTNFGFSDTFTLTHIPSGLAIEKSWKKPWPLKRLMRRLAVLNWERTADELRADLKLQKKLRQFVSGI